MCGIFGIAAFNEPRTRDQVIKTLVDALQLLEYRGYDSAGIAVDYKDTNLVYKTVGEVSRLRELSQSTAPVAQRADGEVTIDTDLNERLQNYTGIAHTRWATHGTPSVVNSHPVPSSPTGDFLVVHNGIITNHEALRAELEASGHVFTGDTDTETIAKLFQHYYGQMCHRDGEPEFMSLTTAVMARLSGQYAILVKSSHYPDQLIAVKHKSPLVLGLSFPEDGSGKNKEYTAASLDPFDSQSTLSSSNATPQGAEDTAASDTPGPQTTTGEVVLQTTAAVGTRVACPSRATYYFSSDVVALTPFTTHTTYLEDGDVVAILPGGTFSLSHVSQRRMHELRVAMGFQDPADPLPPATPAPTRKFTQLALSVDEIKKGSHRTFMEKEIFEQPGAAQSALFSRVDSNQRRIRLGGIAEHMDELLQCRRVFLVGCGTSYHAGMMAETVIERLCGYSVTSVLASHFIDCLPHVGPGDMCVFISQSGSTADTIAALEYANKCDALTVGIVNTVGSSIYRQTDCGVHINAGYEASVCSTKAYTCQCVSLLMIALCIHFEQRLRQNQPVSDLYDEIFDGIITLPDALSEALDESKHIHEIAKKISAASSCLVLGRGFSYSVAREGALKIKEVSYIHAEGIAAGELKHGTLALVCDDIPLVFVAPCDRYMPKMQNAVAQCTARRTDKAKDGVVIITDDTAWVSAGFKSVIKTPRVHEMVQPLVSCVPLQLLALYLCEERGFDVDKPRNLAKSVTVE
ncbi:SIS domain [Carpediemonas membranifera]|uniref:glutamine--fructose-6-phosphate transaminase (isomerizing) n=1 Tax=Carpediemonas membranifera TaxID=201153 RepID=A0A8J6B8D5_9EUKA|nr:SIS domain [Carpediemonas membranifera]|eukprot:KAG9392142.1 SIS domain [Carpediemonas membranifera]